MFPPFNANNSGETLDTPSNDREAEITGTLYEAYETAYTNQILGLEFNLAGNAFYTLGQIQQLQLDLLEKQLVIRLASKERQQQDQQKKQTEQQEQMQQNTQNYIDYLEKHVQQLERQIRQLKNPDK